VDGNSPVLLGSAIAGATDIINIELKNILFFISFFPLSFRSYYTKNRTLKKAQKNNDKNVGIFIFITKLLNQ
jgi:hypothetical protein